jgi:hypothetical protein
MDYSDLDEFTAAFSEAAAWQATDEAGDNLDGHYFSAEAEKTIRAWCSEFIDANALDLLTLDASQSGHDFALSANGHGAGFFDRGYGAIGTRLQKACRPYEYHVWLDEETGELEIE